MLQLFWLVEPQLIYQFAHYLPGSTPIAVIAARWIPHSWLLLPLPRRYLPRLVCSLPVDTIYGPTVAVTGELPALDVTLTTLPVAFPSGPDFDDLWLDLWWTTFTLIPVTLPFTVG